jgi:hypothetical protein
MTERLSKTKRAAPAASRSRLDPVLLFASAVTGYVKTVHCAIGAGLLKLGSYPKTGLPRCHRGRIGYVGVRPQLEGKGVV